MMYAILKVNTENLLGQWNYSCVKVMDTTSQAEVEEAAQQYIKDNTYLIGKGQLVVAELKKVFFSEIENIKIHSTSLSKALVPAPSIIDEDEIDPDDEMKLVQAMEDEEDKKAIDRLNEDKDSLIASACRQIQKITLNKEPNKLDHLAAKKL